MAESKSVMSLHVPLCALRVKLKQFEKRESELNEELAALNRQRDELIEKLNELSNTISMMRSSVKDFEAVESALKRVFD